MFHMMIWRFLLLILVLGSTLNDQYFVFGESHGCNAYDVCLPGAEDIAAAPRTVTASNTCGDPPGEYCKTVTSCFTCDSSSTKNSHPAHFMIERSNVTLNWWQSQTWWEWYKINKIDPLTVNITLSFNKSYVITGEIRVEFKSLRPSKMVIEKSADFGNTWEPLQYFADQCDTRYGMKPSSLNCSIDTVLCTEKYSDGYSGPLSFSFLSCYTEEDFWDKKKQKFINATDLRLRLEVPYNDGRHGITSEKNLNRYFYAISDIKVHGRCQCNGHAPNCKFEKFMNGKFINTPICMCSHYTTGKDCQQCQPLYNNRTWMPATSSKNPNPCQKCGCHDHAVSCTFNGSLDHGVCDDCGNNTRGYFCEQCEDKFYRNFTKYLNEYDVCLGCNCALDGITNNGSCSQEQPTAGQCMCRENVTGRRCDRCNDTYYGYKLPPVGSCVACYCSVYGTINGSLNCNQSTGQCTCKPNIHLRTCSECKVGFYKFPNLTKTDCSECFCDSGGSTNDICEKTLGKCLCRNDIQGKTCSNVTNNHFFPQFDYFLFEAENQSGEYNLTSNTTEFNRYFTGQGYATITENNFIVFNIFVDIDGNYTFVLRYSDHAFGTLSIRLEGGPKSSCPLLNKTIIIANDLLSNGQGISWTSNDTLMLCSNNTYSIHVSGYGHVDNFSVNVDSVVLLPQLTELRAYKEMATLVDSCLANYSTIQGGHMSSLSCRNVTFSNMIELFNGALACKCSQIGSKSETCNPYGGQCSCRDGVMGRICDKCQPGYYNFTRNGCTPCKCNPIGTKELSVCNPYSGECLCKRAVEGRTCGQCKINFFGLNTGKGCKACNCNDTGAINGTCDGVSGKCYCQPGVEDKETDKCDRCKSNYFNFTETGCQACNCHKSGSRYLQCHHSSGECACKINSNGTKCDRCINGTFGLEESNPSGCTPCFCFNRSQQCSSAKGFIFTSIVQSNITITPDGYVYLPANFTGNQLLSYGRSFEVKLFGAANVSANLTLHLKGSRGNAIFNLTRSQCQEIETGRYCVQLYEKNARDTLQANKMQSILVDLESVTLNLTNWLVNTSSLSVSLGTANKSRSGDVEAVHVEQCDCPNNYMFPSCAKCNSGFTRAIVNSNLTSTSFINCTPCSCNNRSKTCDPETRICSECDLSGGNFCETCSYGVDIGTGCKECLPGFWSKNIKTYGCKDCDCVLNNTLNYNSSVCNVNTGQCRCETRYVKSGLRCEGCAHNYFNTSYGCQECPECYGLIQEYVEMLEKAREDLNDTVKEFDSARYQKFGVRLNQAKDDVDVMLKMANDFTANQNKNELNISLNAFEQLSSNISRLLEDVEEVEKDQSQLEGFLAKAKNVTQEAYYLLKFTNSSLSIAGELTKKINNFTLPLARSKTDMSQLNKTLRETSQNISIINSEALSKKMREVRANASTSKKHLSRNTNSVFQLQNTSQVVSNYAKNTKYYSANHSRNVDDVLLNSESVLKTAQELASLIEESKNRSQTLRVNQAVKYLDLEKNVSAIIKDVNTEKVAANQTLKDSLALLDEAKDENDKANKANMSAKTTLKDARKTLTSVKEFRNLSKIAELKVSNSLKAISATNASSKNSIENVRNVSESVKDALNSTNEAVRVAKRADSLSNSEYQAITSVYKWNKLLQGKQKPMVCSKDLMTNFQNNITDRSKTLAPIRSCPKNETAKVSNSTVISLSQSTKTRKSAIDTNKEVSKVYDNILKTIDDVKDPQTASISLMLKTKIQNQKKSFGDLQEVLKTLRQGKEEKNKYIKQLRARLEILKLEVKDLVSLRDSVKLIPSCGST